MISICESPINVVIEDKPKVLTRPARANRLGPKGKGAGIGAPNSSTADGAPPAERRNLTHAGTGTERGKVRHEVVCVAVMPLIEGQHLLFCQQYPTSTCVTGNGGV